jgi:endoglucanase
MNKSRYRQLLSLLAQPTAPFREQQVIDCVTGMLERAGVPYFQDPFGNLVVGIASERDYRRCLQQPGDEPLRLFIAHMDHPGFHGVAWRDGRLAVQWHGGSPIRHLNGSRVWLASVDGWIGDGRLVKASLLPNKRALDRAEVVLATENPPSSASTIYGGFGFRAPVWRQGQRLYTKAADDLVGVFAIVATALDHFERRRARGTPTFIGLLTRAEEVGFVGAIGHFSLGWLQAARRPVVAVSLETSRTLPKALIGHGPVVRLGDRRTVFHAEYLEVLSELARRVLPDAHQQRVMDGGSCEATAATAFGLPAIGLSVPLGNYHNEGFEGGPDCRTPRGPAPEFVHLADVDGLLTLCRALLRPGLTWSDPWRKLRRALGQRLVHYRRKL